MALLTNQKKHYGLVASKLIVDIFTVSEGLMNPIFLFIIDNGMTKLSNEPRALAGP